MVSTIPFSSQDSHEINMMTTVRSIVENSLTFHKKSFNFVFENFELNHFFMERTNAIFIEDYYFRILLGSSNNTLAKYGDCIDLVEMLGVRASYETACVANLGCFRRATKGG